MPYIKEINTSNGYNVRKGLREGERALTAGELNYQIFYYVKHNRDEHPIDVEPVIRNYVKQFLGNKPNYQKYNDMTGCLVRCAKEIDRRLDEILLYNVLYNIMDSYDDEIARYEDLKCSQNGDVE